MDSGHNESVYSNEINSMPYSINIYVSVNGTPNGDGSIGNPANSIDNGISLAKYGDTVKVLPGKYSVNNPMQKGISLIGTNTDNCIINSEITAADKMVISNLTFTKTIKCNNVSPIITKNIFRGTGNNDVAIRLENASSAVISKNFITNFNLGVFVLIDCTPLIRNNIIICTAIGIDCGSLSAPTIINNTIFADDYSCIRVISMETAIIKNNILVGLDKTKTYGYINQFTKDVTFQYNNIWNSPQTNVAGTGNIHEDPMFVNADIQDYRLQDGSPCKNTGDPGDTYLNTDGSRNDMGAFGGSDPMIMSSAIQLNRSIYISKLSAYPSDTVSAFVSLDNPNGLLKYNFSINYDNSLLDFVGAKLTDALKDFNLNYLQINSSKLSFSIAGDHSAATDKQNILEVQFVVNSNASSNDASPLTLSDISLQDVNQNDVIIKGIRNGVIVVNNFGNSQNFIYVDCNNNGTQDGSRRDPYKTVMQAMKHAVAGDTIFVSGGEYKEAVTFKEGISLIGSGATVTKLTNTEFKTGIIFDHINNALLKGFTISKAENTPGADPLIGCESSSPTIENNCIQAEPAFGMSVILAHGSNATFRNNYLNNVDLNITASNPLVEDNFILGAMLRSVFCNDTSKATLIRNTFVGAVYILRSNPIIRNNKFMCDPLSQAAINLREDFDVDFSNNIITDSSNFGQGVIINSSNNISLINNTILTHGKGITADNSEAVIMNNIVAGNNNYGIQYSSSSRLDYNDFWNNSTNYNNNAPGANDISANPLFVDSARQNFQLAFNSECIDAGNPDQKYNDLDGSRNDIGFTGGPSADTSFIKTLASSLGIDSVTTSLSDTVLIKVKGNNLAGIAQMNINLSYDPSLLKIINANTTSITKTFSLDKSENTPGSMNLNLVSSKGITTGSGNIINLKIVANTNHSTETQLGFQSAVAKDANTNPRDVINFNSGIIKIMASGMNDKENNTPKNFMLHQNYPNPFNPVTTIRYELPKGSKVVVKIYDILGREVATLFNGYEKAGKHDVKWNALNFASGIYFYSIRAGNFVQTKKMLLLK